MRHGDDHPPDNPGPRPATTIPSPDTGPRSHSLPQGEAPPRERADAVRNRAQILAAAERLFAENDPRTVTMGDVAKAAGVGRATLYRRFPDIASIAVALLDEHERHLQSEIVFGPPPLGPGAPPGERLAAFYTAAIDLLDRHLPLALGAETGRRRFTTGAYAFWRLHVGTLLDAAGAGDRESLADLLLAPLDPDLFAHQRDTVGLGTERIAAALRWTAHRLLDPPTG